MHGLPVTDAGTANDLCAGNNHNCKRHICVALWRAKVRLARLLRPSRILLSPFPRPKTLQKWRENRPSSPPELLLSLWTKTAGGCPVSQEKQFSQKQTSPGIRQAGKDREKYWPFYLIGGPPSSDVSGEEMLTSGEVPARLALPVGPLLRISVGPRPVCGSATEPHRLIPIMGNRDNPEQPVGIEAIQMLSSASWSK
ncbi:hypothetical protein LZ32DRAFT_647546 [Colletotrichum eremochloae]|nr:hypothetical protein LZ32DRAFT_647546 [Colletotrichum eremochloae]